MTASAATIGDSYCSLAFGSQLARDAETTLRPP